MSAISAASSGQVTSVRAKRQASKIYAAIFNPTVVAAAQVNGTPTSKDKVTRIPYHNVTAGSYTDLHENMIVWVGSAPGLDDIGQVRLRSADASELVIGETSEVNWADGQYLSALNDYPIWQKHLSVSDDGTARMDGDVDYTDQNENQTPIVIMGTHAIKEITGASVSTAWDASDSWCPGSSIVSYLWTCPGGTIDDPTSATPNISFILPIQYLVECQVTAANGKTAIGRRGAHIYAKNAYYEAALTTASRSRSSEIAILQVPGHGFSGGEIVEISGLSDDSYNIEFIEIAVVDENTISYPCVGDDESTTSDTGGIVKELVYLALQPSKVSVIQAPTVDYQRGGVEFSIRMYAHATTTDVHSRALVVLFTEDWYDGVRESVGQIPDRANVLAVGWINREGIVANKNGGYVEFTCSGPQYWLGYETTFALGIENCTGTPAAWTEMQNMTLNDVWAHYAKWRCTLSEVCDVYPIVDTRVTPACKAPSGSLWQQITEFIERQILARPCSDRFGRVFCEVDTNYVPLADRADIPTIMTLTGQDITGEITFERIDTPVVSRLTTSGIALESGSNTPLTFWSLSPGHAFGHFGTPEVIDRLLVSSQEQSNSQTGLILGQRNNEYPRIDFTISENNRLVDVCPRQFIGGTIPGNMTPRGITLSGRFIPRTVSWQPQDGSIVTIVSCEAETFEQLSCNGDIPVSNGPPIVPPPVPPGPPPAPGPTPPVPPVQSLLDILVVLIYGYGLFYTSVADGYYRWFSANAPFTSVQKAAINRLELSRSGMAYVTLSASQDVFSTQIGYGIKTKIADFSTYGSGIWWPSATGMNPTRDDGFGLIASRSYPGSSAGAFTMLGGVLTYTGASLGKVETVGNLSNWGGQWYYTAGWDIFFSENLTRYSGDFTAEEHVQYITGPGSLFHERAAAADYIYLQGPLQLWTNKGETKVRDIGLAYYGASHMVCDPTGQHVLFISGDTLRISHDFAASFTDITATVPGTSISNGVALNMGDALKWCICYNDVNAAPGPTLNIWRTIDGCATWVNCGEHIFSAGVPTNGSVSVARHA